MPRSRRSLTALALRQIALVVALAAAILGALLWSGRLVLPYRQNPFATLDVTQPPDWLTGFRLRRAARGPALCLAALRGSAIAFTPVPDRQDGPECGLSDALVLAPSATRLAPGAPMTCAAALGWLMTERHVAAPAARARFGQALAGIGHLGTYSCRRIAGSDTRWSEHARANALDIAAFTLADGRRITLSSGWTKDGPEAAFLRDVRDGACRYFNVALGPDYNAAHADHFHLDQGGASVCR